MNPTMASAASRARSIVEGLTGRALASRLERRGESRFTARTPGVSHSLSTSLTVSLTSFPPRFSTLHLTLKCLLTQSVQPDRVVLWVAVGDRALLPESVLTLQEQGLSIEECEDWRPYKKIIPELIRDPSSCIVTADDDVYYGPDWLQELVDAHVRHDGCVVAHRSHHMVCEGEQLVSYEQWKLNAGVPVPSFMNFAVGIGGVLYPPGCLHPDVTDPQRFLEHSPNNDDIWLNWMAKLVGTKCVSLKRRFIHTWKSSQEVGLYQVNRGGRGNDIAIASTVGRYGPSDIRVWSEPSEPSD
jgi:hypothetical protein